MGPELGLALALGPEANLLFAASVVPLRSFTLGQFCREKF
jgi:hypothetical protein